MHDEPVVDGLLTPVYRQIAARFATIAEGAASVRKRARFGVTDSGAYSYTRFGNPTVSAVERQLARLVGASWTLLTCSGMAAIDAAASVLEPERRGAPWLVLDSLYDGTRGYVDRVLRALRGVPVRWVAVAEACGDGQALIERLERERPAVLMFEALTQPFMFEPALPAILAKTSELGVRTIVDNTAATHLRVRPLELGADIVVESLSKYLGGHGDLLAGAVSTRDGELADRVYDYRKCAGTIANPSDAALLAGYLTTFELRYARQSASARAIVATLRTDARVSQVWYPREPPSGGLITFALAGATAEERLAACERFVAAVADTMIYATSFGATHSSIFHLSTFTGREGFDAMLRIAVGVEDEQQLVAAVRRGLDAL